MREFIEEENLHGAFSYVDNIIITRHNEANHDRNFAFCINAIQRRKFILNESTTIGSVESLNILGYIVGNTNIKPDPERMRAVENFSVPNNKNAFLCIRYVYILRQVD